MDVLFSLSIPQDAQQKLEERVAKGEVVTPEELDRDFSPKAADLDALVAWLKTEGYQIIRTSPDRTSVYARATVANIQKSLQVQMVRVTRDGRTYTAARNAPSLPASVGTSVQAIVGLQPFRHANKNARLVRYPRGTRSPRLTGAAAPAPAIANAPPYLVSEVLQAYNGDGLKLTGAGQVIAILIDTLPDDNDLQKFWARNNLDVTLGSVQKINVQDGPLPPIEGEETLDVEWATGIAPGATVRVYASGSLEFVDLDMALDRIIQDRATIPGLRQVSISLGLGETFMAEGEARTQNQKFRRLAALGVNVFVSSGDAGSNPDGTGHESTGPLQAEFQASDPFVIAVGGTTLRLGPSGAVSDEEGWSSSGGGKSMLFSRPTYQRGNGVVPGAQRLVPDVALAADPETGAFIVLHGQEQQIGGTSWSAPTWAGFCALLNEARAKAGKPSLGFLNPSLYPLNGTASFRDITVGNNGAFNAGPGYDLVTGIGVPNLKELADALTK
jgi:kumamolisin